MSVNWVGFGTIVKREIVRTTKIINQVVWPPIITTALYVIVFGLGLGRSIPTVQGVPYATFLIPGLIMLQVIDQTYGESSSSMFQGRFMNSIQELLIAPLSAAEIVAGFLVSSVLRAIAIALLILLAGVALVGAWPANWPVFFAVTVLVALLFGGIGLIFGLLAEKFDHIAIFTTFVITPLVFVGGVFARVGSLPEFVRNASMLNPMFYMIDAFRFSYTGHSDEPLGVSFAIVTLLAVLAVGIALRMTATGYKLRA